MDAEVSTFIENVKAGNVLANHTSMKLAELQKIDAKAIKPIIDYMVSHLKEGNQEVVSEIKVADDDTAVFRLESNLINLPLDEIDRINKMISDQESLPVNVYLVVVSEFVNQSGLRIDEVTSADDFIADPDSFSATITDWISEKATAIAENKASEDESKK
ncbi:hypothetical protein PL11_004825 [Lentilactobacillus curieae]|uniref:Uncharacterized protein n=1 Tax=Lentilactobacillus curieae TaxID=1138822 RepID=A0A1S6QI61_9LACO|nr:hypothetical protein [Lentilactobacillus curieae]AQW21296.1 hypothetical protein PL11_004825 [Lentilactobacillus curieae]